MRMLVISGVAAAMLIGGASVSFADQAPAKGRIQARKETQQKRIAKGIENGSVTPKEAAKLEAQEAKLNRQVRRDRADGGGLTPQERAKIEHKQDQMSRKIYRQKHDAQTKK